MGERRTTLILILILSITVVSISEMKMVQSESSSEVTLNDEHYVVNNVMGMFGGNVSLCSFNATKGYWIELELSSSSSDSFKVFLDILSANHGIIFSAIGKNFSQTVYLDYEDTYEITISKSPFYSSVRVRGTISVFHQETAGQSSSGNWVEVARFTGGGNIFGDTPPFAIDHVKWRIRWQYTPKTDYPTAFTIDIQTHEVASKTLYTVCDNGTQRPKNGTFGQLKENGTCYINDHKGTFHFYIVSNAKSYTIIVEQNLESIPEFPSWIILPIFVTASLCALIVKKKLF